MIDLHSDSTSSSFYPHTACDPPFSTARTFDPYAEHNNPLTGNTLRSDLTPTRSTEFSSKPLVPNRLGSSGVRRTPSLPSGGQDILIPFTEASSAGNSPRDTKQQDPPRALKRYVHVPSSQPPIGQSPLSLRQDTSPLLTDEQIDFINSLHRKNITAAAIASVVERMIDDQHAGIQEWERETRLARTNMMATASPTMIS